MLVVRDLGFRAEGYGVRLCCSEPPASGLRVEGSLEDLRFLLGRVNHVLYTLDAGVTLCAYALL